MSGGKSKGASASRRQARVYALQALYHADHADLPAEGGLKALWDTLLDGEGVDGERAPEADEVSFAERLVAGVQAHRDALDGLIEGASTNWRVRRMPVVDRNVLRMAAFELSQCPDIPSNVAINEAIELAKLFGGDDSRSFVNGIVDRLGRQLGRLPASGRPRRDA